MCNFGIDIKEEDGAVSIRLMVRPRASKNEVSGVYDGALKIKITSPPVDGRANEQCVRFLAGEFGVSKGALTILSGFKGKSKRLRVAGLDRSGLEGIFRTKGYV